MSNLARAYGGSRRPDGTFVFPTVGGLLEVDGDGVWRVKHDGSRVAIRHDGDTWTEGGGPWSAGPVAPQERLLEPLRRAAQASDPPAALIDAMARGWLEARAAHLLEASEMDLASVHAPFPVVLVPVLWLMATTALAVLGGQAALDVLPLGIRTLQELLIAGGVVVALAGGVSGALLSPLFLGWLWQERSLTLTLTAHQVQLERTTGRGTSGWTLPTAQIRSVEARGRQLVFTTHTGRSEELVLKGRTAATAEAVAHVIGDRVRRAVRGTEADVPEALRRRTRLTE